jgi:hypothetical protein
MNRLLAGVGGGRALSVLLLLVLASACSRKLTHPSATPVGDQAPVTLRNIQVANIAGHRAVLLRLSRVPTLVRHTKARGPARILVEAWGPTGEDIAEKTLPALDMQISQVRVSRHEGALSIILDLAGDEPPPYTVHEMADWIMVRFASADGEGKPGSIQG